MDREIFKFHFSFLLAGDPLALKMSDNQEAVPERPSQLRNKLSKYVNLGLSVVGIIFIITGVFKSTLLLYVGCALVGAAVGGFIRSRLPVQSMGASNGLHVIYRAELQRNVQSYHDNMQTFIVMHAQQPCGIRQKKINQYTTIKKYQANMTIANSDSFDKISMISSMTERTEPGEACCIVCLIQFKNGQEVRQLPCQHVFHIGCIDRWLKINRLCPTCRRDVTVPVKLRHPPMTSPVHDIEAESNVIVLNNQRAVEDDNSRLEAASSSGTNDASPMATTSSLGLREDNIALENDLGTSLMPSGSTDVVITVADVTCHVPS